LKRHIDAGVAKTPVDQESCQAISHVSMRPVAPGNLCRRTGVQAIEHVFRLHVVSAPSLAGTAIQTRMMGAGIDFGQSGSRATAPASA
jgi:hypothetical protein